MTRSVIAFPLVIDHEFVNQVPIWPVHADSPEKSRLPPQFGALVGRQPVVDFLQMAFSVVAGDAFQVDAQEHAAAVDGQFVVGIFGIAGALVGLVYVEADQKVGRSRVVVRARGRRQKAAYKFVVGLVDCQKIVQVFVEEDPARPHSAIDAQQLCEEVSPAV